MAIIPYNIKQVVRHKQTTINQTFQKEKTLWDIIENYLSDNSKQFESLRLNIASPMFAAVKLNNPDLCKKIICSGGDIDETDQSNNTPIFYAIINNFYQVTKMLIKLGCDTVHHNVHDLTPIRVAILQDNKKIVKLLIKYGVNPISLNVDGLFSISSSTSFEMYKTIINATRLFLLSNEKQLEIFTQLDKHHRTICFSVICHLFDNNHYNSYPQSVISLDNGITYNFIQHKLLGHRFSLKNNPIFEAMLDKICLQELNNRINFFNRTPYYRKIFPEKLLLITLLDSNIEKIMHKIKNEEIFSIYTNLGNHSSALAFCGKWIAIGNRGKRNEEIFPKPGITFYKIKSFKNLKPTLEILLSILDKNTSRIPPKDFQKFNEIELVKRLKLNKVFFIEFGEQKTGNCSWIACKLNLLAQLAFSFYKKNKIFNQSIIIQAFSLYKKIIYFDRLEAIQEFQPNNIFYKYFDYYDIYKQIAFKAVKYSDNSLLKSLLSKAPAIIHSLNEEGNSLLHIAVKIDHTQNIFLLIKHGVDATILNDQGETALSMSINRKQYQAQTQLQYYYHERKRKIRKKMKAPIK